MPNIRILKFVMLSGLLLNAACSMEGTNDKAKIEKDELVFAYDPEPVKGKLDVYDSMARGAKYNVDVASTNLSKKIDEQSAKYSPQKIIDGLTNVDMSGAEKLYQASQILEFSVIYSMANLSDSQVYKENYFYEKASQHLALAAIRSHQNALFAQRKIKELQRLMRQEKKIIENLNSLMEKSGSLSDDNLQYKKQLDVAMLKMEELQKALNFSVEEYARLVKADPQKVSLEGRQFYELEDFDKGYDIEIFQEAAVRNRKEFALAKEKVKSYAATDLRRDISNHYPLVKRLDINGLDIEDSVYEQELYEKAMRVAYNLLAAVQNYRQAKDGSNEKIALQRRLFDELGAAVLTQSEVSYRLIEQADVNYQNVENAITENKKEIKILEKMRSLNNIEKAELLNRKIMLLNQEKQAAQISADRAVFLRSLYFNAGLSPLNKQLLKAPIKDVANDLRKAFNKDLIDMLSGVELSFENRSQEQKGWAQKENWLEEVVDGSQMPKTQKTVRQEKISVKEAANYSSMQLGAYTQKESAENDWKELSVKFPELKNYQKVVEDAGEGEFIRYRLIVKADGTKLVESCNNLKASGFECLLR